MRQIRTADRGRRRMVIIVMGVAGAGKTTVGRRLAQELGWAFYDADDFHPPSNVEKMEAGVPLTDDDREPWLDDLRSLIKEGNERGENAVLACSALRRSYRTRLTEGTGVTALVYLRADPALIRERLDQRSDHFMPARLAQSQFETLEEPDGGAVTVSASLPVAAIVQKIMSALDR